MLAYRFREALAQTIENHRLGLTQPGELAFRELSGSENSPVTQGGLIVFALQMRPCLPVTDTAHGRQIRRERITPAQVPQLLDQSVRQHGIEALGDTFMQ